MNEDRLTIRIIGQAEMIAASSLVSVLGSTLEILGEIDAEVSGQHRGVLEWRIADVSLESPLHVTVTAESDATAAQGSEVIMAYTQGLAQLEQGAEPMPRWFTVAALEEAQKVVSVLDHDVKELAFIGVTGDVVSPTQHLAAHVSALLPEEYEEVGTVVGKLDMLSVHRDPTFAIWEDLTDARLPCSIPPERIEEAHSLFRERVSVYGTIRYHPDGRPKRMIVKRMERLPRHDELRSVRDMPAVNITDGLDPSEYVRRLRNA